MHATLYLQIMSVLFRMQRCWLLQFPNKIYVYYLREKRWVPYSNWKVQSINIGIYYSVTMYVYYVYHGWRLIVHSSSVYRKTFNGDVGSFGFEVNFCTWMTTIAISLTDKFSFAFLAQVKSLTSKRLTSLVQSYWYIYSHFSWGTDLISCSKL